MYLPPLRAPKLKQSPPPQKSFLPPRASACAIQRPLQAAPGDWTKKLQSQSRSVFCDIVPHYPPILRVFIVTHMISAVFRARRWTWENSPAPRNLFIFAGLHEPWGWRPLLAAQDHETQGRGPFRSRGGQSSLVGRRRLGRYKHREIPSLKGPCEAMHEHLCTYWRQVESEEKIHTYQNISYLGISKPIKPSKLPWLRFFPRKRMPLCKSGEQEPVRKPWEPIDLKLPTLAPENF